MPMVITPTSEKKRLQIVFDDATPQHVPAPTAVVFLAWLFAVGAVLVAVCIATPTGHFSDKLVRKPDIVTPGDSG